MSSKELLKILLSDGWYIVRQRGSHMMMRHPVKSTQLVIPMYSSKDLGKGLLHSILKRAQISLSDK